MKKAKYLPLYYKWMETGRIKDAHNYGPSGGLCNTIIGHRTMKIFEPTDSDFIEYNIHTLFWGHGGSSCDPKRVYSFSELRQTIVLLLAAMNDEL